MDQGMSNTKISESELCHSVTSLRLDQRSRCFHFLGFHQQRLSDNSDVRTSLLGNLLVRHATERPTWQSTDELAFFFYIDLFVEKTTARTRIYHSDHVDDA